MEVKHLGNVYGEQFGTGYAGNVWDSNTISPTLMNMQGGGRQPMIIENIPCTTSRVKNGEFVGVDDLNLINAGKSEAGAVVSRYYKGIEGDHSDEVIVAMRGRNPENPSDRTVGAPTEQRLEPNSQGLCNTLTSVQKDNLVMEKVLGVTLFESDNFGGLKVNKDGTSPTLRAEKVCAGAIQQYRIRKLTPLECWRLMDFSDEDFEKAAQVNSRTQLYKQAGNSIVKNVLVAIIGQMIPGKENVYKRLESEQK